MSTIIFGNNAKTTLANSITNTATTAILASGTGALFPTPGAGQYFVLTFNDTATGLLYEIVHVTAIVGDTITITRGQEGTAARAWNAADIAFSGPTGGQMAAMAQSDSAVFTNTPQAPTAANGNSTNQLSTTQFVQNAFAIYSAPTTQGAFKNLKSSSTGLDKYVYVTADQFVLKNASSIYATVSSVNVIIDTTTAGANGIDTGSIAANTWYSVWIISNGSTTAGLISLSATSPTLPGGYTFYARSGWIRTDSTSNKFPIGFTQFARNIQYRVGNTTNLVALPQIASGSTGNVTTPVFTAQPVAAFVPSTASIIKIVSSAGDNLGASWQTIIAPNNTYGGYTNSTTAIAPFCHTGSVQYTPPTVFIDMMLESSNIYYASNNSAHVVGVFGWEDNL